MIHSLYRIMNFCRRTVLRLLRTPSLGVKALVVNDHNEVLLVEHTYIDGWHLPGGGLAYAESPKMAVIRELREETGVVAIGEPILFKIYTHKVHGASDYPILYIIRQFEVHPQKPSSEIKRAQWFALDKLPPETTESTRFRLKEYFENHLPSEHW